jgi:hypothetical protein
MKLRTLGAIVALLLLTGLVQAQSNAPGQVGVSATTVSWTPTANVGGSTPALVSGYNLYLATTDAALTALPNTIAGTPNCPANGPFLLCAISVAGATTLSATMPALYVGSYAITVTAWYCTAAGACVESAQGPHVAFSVLAPYVPQCYPKVKLPPAMASGTLPAGVSARYDSYAVWVCNLPTGYVTTTNLFASQSNVLKYAWNYVFGSWTAAQAQADCVATCVPPSGAEQLYMNTLSATYQASAKVSGNGSIKTRVVFAATANDTVLGAQSPTSRVHVGTTCNPSKRLPGTSYYSVQGQTDAANAPAILGDVFALCAVTLPVGAN